MSKRILSFFPINSASGKMESLEDFFDSKQMIWKLFGLPFLEGQTTRSRRLPSTPFLNRFSVSPYEFATQICIEIYVKMPGYLNPAILCQRWALVESAGEKRWKFCAAADSSPSQQKTCLCDSLFVDLTVTKMKRLQNGSQTTSGNIWCRSCYI